LDTSTISKKSPSRWPRGIDVEDRTIILAVLPANADMSTSQGLDLARKWDPTGQRTLGVITKIDIMDRGTDAKKMILNQEIPLALGFVGIKNRSQ